ncbi:Ureidoglycolate lyase [uncultured Clostridium sp.]|nr:Ureidoglycolate lyase [uncultured Clostridium sp.]
MKITRFIHDSKEKWGALNEDKINIIKGNIFEEYEITEEKVSLDDVKLLAPCSPTKGICVGLNYRNHAKEMNEELPKEPLIFMKPSSSLNNPNSGIKYPSISKNLHYEAELGIVIKKKLIRYQKIKLMTIS